MVRLIEHFEARDRPEASGNLRAALVYASERIERGQGLFFDAPRPYSQLVRPGWIWTKQGRYWIAFSHRARVPIIQAVFYEAANIPGRL